LDRVAAARHAHLSPPEKRGQPPGEAARYSGTGAVAQADPAEAGGMLVRGVVETAIAKPAKRTLSIRFAALRSGHDKQSSRLPIQSVRQHSSIRNIWGRHCVQKTSHHRMEVGMRKLISALAIAGMAVLFSAPGAEAATCWWNGWTWVCKAPPHGGYWRHRHWHHWREGRDWRWHHRHYWDYGRPYAWYR
jgi:hypothetical protein